MPDRRRQRQQRVRHDAGGSQNPVGASNRESEPEPEKISNTRAPKQGGSGVAYAEPREYESVTVMPDKEVAEPQRYHRPGVLSNWSRYEEVSTDDIDEGEDYLIGEDFSLVLEQQANSGGGFLQLKGESSWEENEASILTSHGLGVLHVADLVSAMSTLPLYTQLNMPEESLPESVLEYYAHLAEDNRKVYQPNSSGYNDCLDVNQKIIQSLKISDNEPLELSSEEQDTKLSTRNAVDVALSLSEAFDQVPEDVDLTAFIQEPVVERQPSPVKQPSPVRQPSPKKPTALEEQPCTKREPSPVKHPSTTGQPCVQNTTSENISVKKRPKAKPGSKPNAKSKEKSPTNFNFGLQKEDLQTSNTKASESNQDIPKVKDPTNSFDVKDILNVEGAFAQNEDDEKTPGGPTVDLDAPEEKSKPVLLVSKTEAEDLEDWLDSMLDD